MQTYFTAIQPHLQDRVDIAYTSKSQHIYQKQSQSTSLSRSILSLGIDNLIYVRDLQSDEQDRIELSQMTSYRCISQWKDVNSCVLGSDNGVVEEFNLSTKETKLVYKSQYRINTIVLSPTKKYLALATQQSKAILINLHTNKSSKCRPGHNAGVATISFDEKQNYLASIGQDGSLIIYNITNSQQPVQMFQFKIVTTKSLSQSLINLQTLSGSFNKNLDIYYAPGAKQLQIIQLLNNKWQHRSSKFVKLQQPITLIKMIKINLMITSSNNQFVIWNNRTQQKLIEIQNFSLNKIIQVGQTFWGTKNDGRIFWYNKKVLVQNIHNKVETNRNQRMQLEHNNNTLTNNHFQRLQQNYQNDLITFDDNNNNNGIDIQQHLLDGQQQQQQQEQDKKSQLSYHSLQQEKRKKSKADRLITAYPQAAIATNTSIYDSARYLATSDYGYIIQRIENQYQLRIQYQQQDKQTTQLLFINKKILYVDFNTIFLAYANQTQYGLKFFKSSQSRMIYDQNDSWEKQWQDIVAIVTSYNWIAVANDQQIKIFDIMGNQIKTISFDRLIVAMAAYENLLAVVYHQSIPIDGSQCLAMQLFVVNSDKLQILGHVSTSHVPLTRKSVLKYFRFSSQGMLLSHDDAGVVRVYSLQHNSWLSVIVEGADDTRRIWLLGMKDYQLVYWKTSQLNPDPQVFPRLPVKTSRLGTTVTTDDPQKMRQYPYLMFERFVLDHEKCRSRLWSYLKNTLKQQKYPGYKQNLSTILSIKQINQRHNQLDYKFFEIIKFYLENVKSHQKALMASKTIIRTLQAGKKLIDIFDDLKLRSLAVDLEIYFEEKEKQLQYQMMQKLQLNNLKLQAQKNIKPKGQNHPFNRKKNNNNNNDISSIPSLNNTQLSQMSNFDSLSQKSSYKPSRENGMKMTQKPPILQTPQKEDFSNPFLKKKSTDEQANHKARQIQEQIEKYGIKKKADINKRPHKQF